ncbi:acyl-CoA dehydrogenase family protein [Streptomyces sp. CA-106131]|uniref:acyl-CoA dehydrogenase family protein n=1 Tax=Streptomyces sp. CA-106131 TaxID=3240045 RepID=UPI003D8EFC71
MRLLPTQEQRAMAQAVRDALTKECTPETLRESWDGTPQHKLQQTLAGLGLFGLTVSEEFGGLGLDERDAIGVFEETGRAAVPGPIAESFAACYALQAAGSALGQQWLPRIASGEAVASLGLGDAPLVESADRADLLILQHGDELHAVEGRDVQVEREQSVDGNRRLFTVSWEATAQTRLVSAAARILGGTRDRLLLATSAQLLGLARKLLDMAVAHVNIREQFGGPLGSFQAVQHRLADVAVGADFTAPVVARAACSLAADAPSAARDVAMAKVFASEAAEHAAYSALQLHGAIGYTREHDLHIYSLRAWTLALAHGDARTHRARVAADLLSDQIAPRYP